MFHHWTDCNFSILAGKFLFSGQKNHFKASKRTLIKKLPADIEKLRQIYLTLWFSVFFGSKWAKAYRPGTSKAEHTKEIPGYTYAIGALCTFVLVLGIAIVQSSLEIESWSAGLELAAFISVAIILSTTVPGYAFLKRWNALWLAVTSQVSLVFILSVILALWG